MNAPASVSAAVWVEAARPRTLPAAVAPVLVGTAVAAHAAPQSVVMWRGLAALIVALSVQVAVNYANDYFDGVRGVDTPDRTGPRRAVAAGVVAPAAMKRAVGVSVGVAALAGLALAAAAGWELLLVGAACFAALLGYSGGPKPYASVGLGELFVFVFFGLVATVGSTYVHAEAVVAASALAAVPVGLLATAILVANNLRDIPSDAAAGKRTLAVRLGDRGSRWLYVTLIALAFAWVAVVDLGTATTLLALASLVFAVAPVRAVLGGARGTDLIGVLGGTARLQLVFAVLLSLGYVVG